MLVLLDRLRVGRPIVTILIHEAQEIDALLRVVTNTAVSAAHRYEDPVMKPSTQFHLVWVACSAK
jgi:hypothetical protein